MGKITIDRETEMALASSDENVRLLAWGKCFGDYRRVWYAHAMKKVNHNHQVAEDLTHIMYLNVFGQLRKKPLSPSQVPGYFFTTLNNLATSHHRANRRLTSLDEYLEGWEERERHPHGKLIGRALAAERPPSPGEHLATKWLLRDSISQLRDPKDSVLMLLNGILKYGHQQIACLTGYSRDRVSHCLMNARRQFIDSSNPSQSRRPSPWQQQLLLAGTQGSLGITFVRKSVPRNLTPDAQAALFKTLGVESFTQLDEQYFCLLVILDANTPEPKVRISFTRRKYKSWDWLLEGNPIFHLDCQPVFHPDQPDLLDLVDCHQTSANLLNYTLVTDHGFIHQEWLYHLLQGTITIDKHYRPEFFQFLSNPGTKKYTAAPFAARLVVANSLRN
jgi:RNA polymerase sigma factor (sigma-70 family)